MKTSLSSVLILFVVLTGCKTYDVTLSYYDVDKPMQFGNFDSNISLAEKQNISAYLEIENEDDTFSVNGNSSIWLIGGEYVTSNIDSVVVLALNEHPSIFLGNVSVDVEIRHGIKPAAVIFGLFAGSITGNESDIGLYTVKRFTQNGTIYDINAW